MQERIAAALRRRIVRRLTIPLQAIRLHATRLRIIAAIRRTRRHPIAVRPRRGRIAPGVPADIAVAAAAGVTQAVGVTGEAGVTAEAEVTAEEAPVAAVVTEAAEDPEAVLPAAGILEVPRAAVRELSRAVAEARPLGSERPRFFFVNP